MTTKQSDKPKQPDTELLPKREGMISEKVPISQITIPETRVTAVYDDELRELLKGTMQKMGMISPIVLVQTPDGYRLVDGLHRLQEKIASGAAEIDAVIYQGEEKDSLLINLVLNKTRGKTKASEMVKVIGALYRDYGMDPDAIKESTGFSRDYIEKLIKISGAAESVQALLDQEVIGVGHAFEISKLPTQIQQDEICAKAQLWRWSVKELHDFVEETLRLMKETPEAPPPSPVQTPTKYYCEGCKKEADLRYLRPTMLCPNCFGIVWREQQKATAPTTESQDTDKEAPATPPE